MSVFSIPVRVYYEDTDSGGVVYYANYLKFFERARTEYLRQFEIDQQKLAREEQIVFVVRSAQIDYLRPAKLDDELTVSVEVKKRGAASFRFYQQAYDRYANDLVYCKALITVACVSTDSLKPTALPEVLTRKANPGKFIPEKFIPG